MNNNKRKEGDAISVPTQKNTTSAGTCNAAQQVPTPSAAEKQQETAADAYGRGVTAGKLEALQYTAEERERYGKWAAINWPASRHSGQAVEQEDLSRKIAVLDAANQMLRGLIAVKGVLRAQQNAKHSVGGKWNDGYAAAMDDAIRSIDGLIDEIEDLPIPKSDSGQAVDKTDNEWPDDSPAAKAPNSPLVENYIRLFVESILHGDEVHRAWLVEAAECFIAGEHIPPARALKAASLLSKQAVDRQGKWTVNYHELITPIGNRYMIEDDHQTGTTPAKRLKDEITAALAAERAKPTTSTNDLVR